MIDALKRVFAGSLDDEKGLVPAQLTGALTDHQAFRAGSQGAWARRFACAADQLQALAAALPAADRGLEIAVIGGESSGRAAWEDALEAAATQMNAFAQAADGRAEIGSFEIRVPDLENFSDWMRDLRGFDTVAVYAELPLGEAVDDAVAILAELDWLGAKARMGGGERLGSFLHACLDLEVPFKVGGIAPDGLIPVIGAVALALGEDLTRRELDEMLTAGPVEWRVGDGALTWREHRVSIDDLRAVRDLVASFGVTSLRESEARLLTLG